MEYSKDDKDWQEAVAEANTKAAQRKALVANAKMYDKDLDDKNKEAVRKQILEADKQMLKEYQQTSGYCEPVVNRPDPDSVAKKMTEYAREESNPGLSAGIQILKEAIETIINRQAKYGSPKWTFRAIADAWECTPEEVAIRMIQMKIVRYQRGRDYDSIKDIIGYAACLAELWDNGED